MSVTVRAGLVALMPGNVVRFPSRNLVQLVQHRGNGDWVCQYLERQGQQRSGTWTGDRFTLSGDFVRRHAVREQL